MLYLYGKSFPCRWVPPKTSPPMGELGPGAPASVLGGDCGGAGERAEGGGTWPRGFLNWFHSFWGRGHFWGFRGESLTLCLHTSTLPSHPPSPALAKFGTTWGHLRGHFTELWAARQVLRDLKSEGEKAGAVQSCLTLCPAAVGRQEGAGAWETKGEGRQRGEV